VHLRNELGACLGVSGGSQAYNAKAVTGTCNDENDHSQYWKFVAIPDSGGWYELKNGHSGLCLTGYLSITDELDQATCYDVHYSSIEWRVYQM
jgi:hypothetical protein